MEARLSDRLSAARLRRFVGREAENALFRSALRAKEPPFFVLHVHGPGGIGKTTLLRSLAAITQQEGARAVWLDARNVDPNPDAFSTTLAAALGVAPSAVSAALRDGGRRSVILIDTYELLSPLDSWLREVFLPDLPAETLVVTAGRSPMSSPWRTDPGWQVLLREVPLKEFTQDECRVFLERRSVDLTQHSSILEFTRGHPLALALVADLFDQQPGLAFQPGSAPDVIKALVDQFLQNVPGPEHRAALEACALVRVIHESLLGEMLDRSDVHDLFEWLRRVSFIESAPFGIYPHELARDALITDLRWRNPDRFARLHDRARAYYGRRLAQTNGLEQQRVLSDYVYLHRDNPVIKPFLDWQETGSTVPEPPTESDLPLLRAMVARHEGEASARWADYWFERQRERLLVFRDSDRHPIGFVLMLALQDLSVDEHANDPAVAAAMRYLSDHAPLREGERATLFRFWMSDEAYQSVSPVQSMIFLKLAQHYLTTPDLAFSFFPVADPAFWEPFCGYADLDRVPDADFEIDGRRFGVFGHDWRAIPPMMWLDRLAARELAVGQDESASAGRSTKVQVLNEASFAESVRDALKAYARPHTLQGNPLLETRLVLDAAGQESDVADRIEAIRGLLVDAASLLESSPRDAHLFRVLDRAYFRPARSQEQAAEMLGLSFSTFRRYLKKGTVLVAEELWRRERGESAVRALPQNR